MKAAKAYIEFSESRHYILVIEKLDYQSEVHMFIERQLRETTFNKRKITKSYPRCYSIEIHRLVARLPHAQDQQTVTISILYSEP